MKNVLFIVTKSQNGGAQKWTKEQIEISSKDFNCYLSTDEDGWLSKNVDVENKYLNILIRKRFSINYLKGLYKFINENQINLIVASSANAGIYARLIKSLNKSIKVIYVSHGWSSIYNGGKLEFLFTFIEKQLSKLTDSILCISEKDYRNAKDIIGIKDNKLKWITNKIYPIKMLNYDTEKNTKLKLLTVARLEPPKRVDLLIEATRDMDIELHVVGDGNLKKELENIKHKNVFFYGEIDGFANFHLYDIFALISDSEGLPLSALEAMSLGMPLILSDVGGCYELIKNNGILVNNEIEEIKKAINVCIKNHEEFSKNSTRVFDEYFNLDLNKEEYLTYYQEVLNG